MATVAGEADRGGRISRWIKLLYTLWVLVLVPEHWRESALSLLWFCNLALLVTLAALWLESSLLASMQAVAVVYWMLLWVFDFALHLATGVKSIGLPLGMSNYMFDDRLSGLSRGLSLYHVWLPFLLLWTLRQLGYDRRALTAQTFLAWAVFLLSYGLTANPEGPVGNLNMVYGLSEREPQAWMEPRIWLGLVMLAWPACVYVPSHLVFRRVFPPPKPEAAAR